MRYDIKLHNGSNLAFKEVKSALCLFTVIASRSSGQGGKPKTWLLLSCCCTYYCTKESCCKLMDVAMPLCTMAANSALREAFLPIVLLWALLLL